MYHDALTIEKKYPKKKKEWSRVESTSSNLIFLFKLTDAEICRFDAKCSVYIHTSVGALE